MMIFISHMDCTLHTSMCIFTNAQYKMTAQTLMLDGLYKCCFERLLWLIPDGTGVFDCVITLSDLCGWINTWGLFLISASSLLFWPQPYGASWHSLDCMFIHVTMTTKTLQWTVCLHAQLRKVLVVAWPGLLKWLNYLIYKWIYWLKVCQTPLW